MANTAVEIDGETFDLVCIPKAKSRMVQQAKTSLLASLGLQNFHSLVEDLGELGSFIGVAFNGVAGHTELQTKVQRVGYKITKLADKSVVTVHKFKAASQSILEELKGAYQYLLDGQEEVALETFSQLTSIAKGMAKAADKLHNDFEQATTDVTKALKDIQREKGSKEERKKAMEKERREFEIRKQKAVMQQKNAIEAEEKAKALYNEAQKREDKAMEAQGSFLNTITLSALTGIAVAAAAAATQNTRQALGTLANIVDKSGYKEAMKMANEEKKKQMEEMQKQRDLRQDAILQCIELAEKIKNCQDDAMLAEAAIEDLHRSYSDITMVNAAEFWKQMQECCEFLGKVEIQEGVEKALEKFSKEMRIKVWTSTIFKQKALRYYSKWVALDDVCGVYMLQIKETRQDLYNYLEDNPTIEQAKKNVRELATTFVTDLKQAQKKLKAESKKALEGKKELEKSE